MAKSNTKSKQNKFIIYLTRILFTLIGYSPYACVFTNKNINIYIIYILGSAFPMFLYGFVLFSFNYILTIMFNLANVELYTNATIERKSNEYILGGETIE